MTEAEIRRLMQLANTHLLVTRVADFMSGHFTSDVRLCPLRSRTLARDKQLHSAGAETGSRMPGTPTAGTFAAPLAVDARMTFIPVQPTLERWRPDS